jgi:flagellar motor protein MotB
VIGLRRETENSDRSEAGGENSYLASSSDLMIGVLFIFLILVAVLALAKKKQEATVVDGRPPAADPRGFITETIGKAIKRVSADTDVDPTTGIISFPEKTLFNLGSARLLPQATADLKSIASELEENLTCFVGSGYNTRGECVILNPKRHTVETIFIEGHTDSIPFATGMGDNYKLSLDRARAVDAELVQLSTLKDLRNDVGQPIFSFSAYADSRPRQGREPSDPSNRRVDLRIVLTYQPTEDLAPGLVNGKP